MDVKSRYRQWLDMVSRDPQNLKELRAIADKPGEIEDRFYTELSFGTAGMRGVLGAGTNRMNIYNVRRLTAGLADYLNQLPQQGEKRVVIGYDSRRMSPEFAREAALVFAGRGIKALLFDSLRPVPVISFAVRHLKAIAGVAITASHNPPQYNGYKVYGADGAQVSPEAAEAISQLVFSLNYDQSLPMEESQAQEKGLLQIIGEEEVDRDYTDMVLGLLVMPEVLKAQGANLSVVFSPLHGSGNLPVRRALKEAGVTRVAVVKEQELPDPDFPTVKAPNPEDPAAFEMSIPLAEEIGATMMFATDPDCDRLGVCVKDGQGVFHTLTGNQIGMLLLHHVLEGRKRSGNLPKNGACIKSIVSTQMAKPLCQAYGVALYDTLTGFKFIGELIERFEQTGEHTFLFGFEESFGYLSGTQVRDKDAVNASLLIVEAACACQQEGITLYDRLQDLYKRYGYYVEQVVSKTLPGKDGLEDMRRIMKTLRETPPKAIGPFEVQAVQDYLQGTRTAGGRAEKLDYVPSDVLYYELPDGHWLCVRPSGTEPKIKLYVNTRAGTQEEAEELNRQLLAAGEALLA